jgi:hypothetical protein
MWQRVLLLLFTRAFSSIVVTLLLLERFRDSKTIRFERKAGKIRLISASKYLSPRAFVLSLLIAVAFLINFPYGE